MFYPLFPLNSHFHVKNSMSVTRFTILNAINYSLCRLGNCLTASCAAKFRSCRSRSFHRFLLRSFHVVGVYLKISIFIKIFSVRRVHITRGYMYIFPGVIYFLRKQEKNSSNQKFQEFEERKFGRMKKFLA